MAMSILKYFRLLVLIGVFTQPGCGNSSGDSDDEDVTTAVTTDTGTQTEEETKKAAEETKKTEAVAEIAKITGMALSSNIDLFGKSSAGSSLRLQAGACEVSELAADSDFCTDSLSTYVNDNATRSIDMANKLQCFFTQAAANKVAQNLAVFDVLNIERSVLSAFIKEDRYIAQVDMEKCFEQGQKGGNGQSTGDARELVKLESFVQKQGDDSLLATYIFDMAQEEGMVRLGAKQNIKAGATDKNPLGLWDLTWAGYQNQSGTLGDLSMKGFVKITEENSDQIKLQLVDETTGMDYSQSGIAMLSLSDSGISSGYAKTLGTIWNDTTGQTENRTYTLNIQDSVALKNYTNADGTQGTEVCLDKSPDTRDVSIWSYGLYDSQGAQLHLQGGFPVVKVVDGKEKHGWAGYWGIWFDQGVTLSNGDTLKRYTFDTEGTQGSTGYTYVLAPGKLIEHTKKSLTVAEFTGVELSIWSQSGEARIEYNGTSFVQTATRGQMGQWQSSTETTYTFSDGQHWVYSEAMGGSVQFTTTSNVPSSITYFEQKVVSNSLADATTLYCSRDCLAAGFSSATDAFQDDPAAGSYIEYTWDAANMVLKYSGTNVTPAAAANLGDQYSWGIATGHLRKVNTGSYDDDTVYYTWETGNNAHNKFSALRDAAGAYVTFDAPLNFLYEHSAANDFVGKTTSEHYGVPVRIEYPAFGQLHGIPWGFDSVTNRWAPAFSIKAGSKAGDYYIRPLEGEERLSVAAEGSCSGLNLTAAEGLTLPENASGWVDPSVTMKGVEPVTLVTEGFIEPGACTIILKELKAAVEKAVEAGATVSVNDYTNKGVPFGCK